MKKVTFDEFWCLGWGGSGIIPLEELGFGLAERDVLADVEV